MSSANGSSILLESPIKVGIITKCNSDYCGDINAHTMQDLPIKMAKQVGTGLSGTQHRGEIEMSRM